MGELLLTGILAAYLFSRIVHTARIEGLAGELSQANAELEQEVAERKRTEEALRQLADETAIIAEIGRIITSTLEIDQVYPKFATELKRLVDFDRIALHVIDRDAGNSLLEYVSGLGPTGANIGQIRPLNDIRSRALIESPRTIVVDDLKAAPTFPLDRAYLDAGLNSMIIVALVSNGRTVGALTLRSRRMGAYTAREQATVERLANQIAPAIENARLYGEAKQSREQQRRLAQQNAVVAEIGRIISSSLDIDEVFERFAEQVRGLIPFDRIAVNLVDLEHDTVTILYLWGIDVADRRTGQTRPLAGTQAEAVVRANASLLIQPEDRDELVSRFPGLGENFDAGMRSFLSVPLVSSDRIIGVLSLRSSNPRGYSDRHITLLESVANQIAGAIANAQLYTERKRAEEELRTLAANLERSNRELEDFASVASHDLQEPLRKVRAFGDRLKAGFARELAGRGQGYLARMLNATERMQTLINDLLTVSRVTTRAEPFVPVDLNEVAEQVLADLEVTVEHAGECVEVSGLPTIDADPTQMRQLLQNLISNSLKFRKEEESPVVNIQGQLLHGPTVNGGGNSSVQRLLRLTVEDNGIGFDEKYLDRIFSIFQRLHSRGKYPGTGIGLAVCRKIAERHGGNITAKGEPGWGAAFIVTLPVEQPKGEEYEWTEPADLLRS